MQEYEYKLIQHILDGKVEKFYKSKYWINKRKEILARDHCECQRCNGKYVHGPEIKHIKLTPGKYIHHIVELRDDPSKMLDSDNLVTLCFECHEVMHDRRMLKQTKIRRKIADERW